MSFSKNFYFLILVFFSTFPAICAILFTPALPEIAQYLNVTPQESQKSISVFLVGYALGFLPWGPIANDLGRKKTTFIGVGIALFGLVLCMLIKSYPSLLILNIGRFLTALGSSVGVKITYTYISDLFSKDEILGKISYLIIAMAISVSLSTALGGYLTTEFGYFSCLIATLGYGLFLLICAFLLPETLKKENHVPIEAISVMQGYGKSFKNKALLKASLIMGSCTSFTYLFASLAPFIVISEMGYTPKEYGFYNFIPSLGIVIGFYMIQFMQSRLSHFTQIKIGIAFIFASVSFIAYESYLGSMTVMPLFIAMAFIYTGIAITFANSSTLALSTSDDKSNTSAIMNFLNMSFCCFVLFSTEAISIKASMLMPAIFFLLGSGLIVFLLILKKDAHFKT